MVIGTMLKYLGFQSKVLVRHYFCLYYQYMQRKSKDLQRKGRIMFKEGTENSPPIKILHGKELMVNYKCPSEQMRKIFCFAIVVNMGLHSADA